jgi:uncharacterized membrane-anchored protein
MRRRIVLLGLLVLAIVQLAVPLRMIANRLDALETGRLFRFRTAPVDPYDAFRGRYVALEMAASTIAVADAADYAPGQKIFVLLENDDEGFARPVGLERRQPHDTAYVAARVAPWGHTEREVRIGFPFDRYYMNEELAPAAERAYREHSGGGQHDAYVAVRIKDGFAVLEELYVAGMPIGDFLARAE